MVSHRIFPIEIFGLSKQFSTIQHYKTIEFAGSVLFLTGCPSSTDHRKTGPIPNRNELGILTSSPRSLGVQSLQRSGRASIVLNLSNPARTEFVFGRSLPMRKMVLDSGHGWGWIKYGWHGNSGPPQRLKKNMMEF